VDQNQGRYKNRRRSLSFALRHEWSYSIILCLCLLFWTVSVLKSTVYK